jgi:hypothetical protein
MSDKFEFGSWPLDEVDQDAIEEAIQGLVRPLQHPPEQPGSVEYLQRLAIENSSAFASLLGKVLPTTLQASESDGGSNVITFQRIIVMPDGQRYIEGVTPKQLSAPDDSK